MKVSCMHINPGRCILRTQRFTCKAIESMQVKLALCQFKVTPSKEENLQTAKLAIQARAILSSTQILSAREERPPYRSF